MAKILIIDDEALTLNLLETFLNARGFEVFTARSGQDGLTLAQIEQPDLIVLDMMLPDVGGEIICRNLRGLPVTANTPILILSALFNRQSQDRGRAAGANAYLPKNTTLPELLNQINRLLNREEV